MNDMGAWEAAEAAQHFNASEWPGEVLSWMHPKVIRLLARWRDAAGVPMYPSPVERAHVRHEASGSRHSTNNGERLSDATDVFLSWNGFWPALAVLEQESEAGGIGLYTDMLYRGDAPGAWVMVHVDTRPERLKWVAYRDSESEPLVYVYEADEPQRYHRILAERGKS